MGFDIHTHEWFVESRNGLHHASNNDGLPIGHTTFKAAQIVGTASIAVFFRPENFVHDLTAFTITSLKSKTKFYPFKGIDRDNSLG